jgi:molybdopterin-containing oxidoreductase family iron-sulfur binding subunit
MSCCENKQPVQEPDSLERREFIKGMTAIAAGLAAVTTSGCNQGPSLEAFLQQRFQELSKTEIQELLARQEKEYTEKYGKPVSVKATPPREGVLFGYALDISRCIGCRRCVYGCVQENNQSRNPQVHWITVLEMEKEKGVDLEEADAYYDADAVPRPGKFYFPVACQQCRNPACVKVCPVNATWQEQDGIVVIDYDWCIGCRCCMSACPYGARHFNWATPEVPADELNTNTEYLGNRPRPKGVVEKCTFCIQRTRQGLYPKCVEVCPVGARKFGNLLDPKSEIRYILENKRVFILKEDLKTMPKFYYYFGF